MKSVVDAAQHLGAVIAQTTSTLAKDDNARNNAALPAMFLAVVVLAALCLGAPRWARAINRRRSAAE